MQEFGLNNYLTVSKARFARQVMAAAVQRAIMELFLRTGRTKQTRKGSEGCEHQDCTDGEIQLGVPDRFSSHG